MSFTIPLAGLIFERHVGHPSRWARVSLELGPEGPRIVTEGHGFAYRLEPTAGVLRSVTRALRRLTPEELLTGRAIIGPVGERALLRLGPSREAA